MNDIMIVQGIFIADTPDSFVSRQIDETELLFGGIKGDRHFGLTAKADSRFPMYPRGTEIANRRQISILSVEELEEVAERLGLDEVKPEWIGANLLVKGMKDLTSLPPNTRFIFPSGAGLICEGENLPCTHAGAEVQKYYPDEEKVAFRFVKAAMNRRGIVASVEREGVIQHGDTIRIIFPQGAVPSPVSVT